MKPAIAATVAMLAIAGASQATPPRAPDPVPAPTPEPATPAPEDDTPELPPISNGAVPPATAGPASAPPPPAAGSFLDGALAAASRGLAWHGYLQLYGAVGLRKGSFRGDFVQLEDRLQLDLDANLHTLHIVGRPQLVRDELAGTTQVGFRELYATRLYRAFDVSFGERIYTWGITDFWPVADIVNPRDDNPVRSWRPIDEKLPAPSLHVAAVLGRITLQALAVLTTQSSDYQLDRTRPFAIPIAVPPAIPITQDQAPGSVRGGVGGGAAMDVALASWKASLYALVGRNPLPTAYARVDATTGAPGVQVENERVAMAAASAQGPVEAIGTLVKAEAAYYRRLDQHCDGATEIAPGTPSCFYLRRVPTARTTFALERTLIDGLDAHAQFITELTRHADVPALPAATMALAPGLVTQPTFNPILTLRLQGNWLGGDFRPSAFVYWSIADEDWFATLDLEYHLTDGLALALGGFWFDGYAADRAKNRFTFAGGLAPSSNVYLRATAWF